jgi:hypothetical protein
MQVAYPSGSSRAIMSVVMPGNRTYRAGESLEDFCRVCKTDRMHTVVVVDDSGAPIRVDCGFCHSEHNYRGGPRIDRSGDQPRGHGASRAGAQYRVGTASAPSGHAPFPIVSERERIGPPMTNPMPVSDGATADDFELILRRIIREEAGITPVVPAEKWRGGTLVLRPGVAGLQEKSWPIETFFHKIVMLRNRLRTLEQQINASELPDDVKVRLQSYISGCYGSLTSFNVLFADDADQFKGGGGE